MIEDDENGAASFVESQDTRATLRADAPSAAKRALAEAEARRAARDEEMRARPAETGGRGGEDPVRYGDWEIKGLACDF